MCFPMMRVAMEVERRQSRNRAGLKIYTAMNTRIENMMSPYVVSDYL